MMRRIRYIVVICLFLCIRLAANNVRVTDLQWDPATLNDQDVLTMTFRVSWENSWRDDYNYDAAYVFFKFRRADAVNESWHHLYLQDEGNAVSASYREDYDCWVSPLSVEGVNLNTGIYIFRKEKGDGNNSLEVTVKWNIKQQMGITLNSSEFADHKILVSAFALEMVYIPRGPFRIGDGKSVKSFRKAWEPILPEYDVVSDTLKFSASSGNPKLAANRANDNTANESNAWVGTPDQNTATGDKNASRWIIDFGVGNEKKITYFGINAASHQPAYYPVDFQLEGSNSPAGPWDEVLWRGSGKDTWSMNGSAYPVQKAIKVTKPGLWRCYRLRIRQMNAGYPIVKAIGMTEQNLEELWDHTVVIDGPTVLKDSVYYLGARDGSVWTGAVPETFPDGYRGFYAMKYEISQEQYARFLNKLSYQQQNGLLDGRLEQIEEGKYIFGDDKLVDHRNGVYMSSEIEGRSAVFSNNYTFGDDPGQDNDGQNIACNYMSVQDMLAYADWAGLRPLTEMEYEKMCRPLYPYQPQKGEYAWNSTRLDKAETLQNAGTAAERTMTGNANYGNAGGEIDGPLRAGSFASENSTRENAGAGFWGCMELSGNLAEMYYNVNHQGLQVGVPSGSGTTLSGHRAYHGDGYLSADGHYSLTTNAWAVGTQYIALRGGSYASGEPGELAVSDRTYHMNALKSANERLPHVTFRLGRSVPDQPGLISKLTLENEECTGGTKDVEDVSEENRTVYYKIAGNVPDAARNNVYTYIWYMQESGDKYWRIMEGKNDKDLVFDNFRTDSINVQRYAFRRKVFTPYADSETSSAYKASVVIEGISFGASSYTLSSSDQVAPFDMTVVAAVPATFSWSYGDIPLVAYKQDAYSSNYKPVRGHFNNHGEEGDYIVTLKVNNRTYEIPLHMEAVSRTYMSTNVPCGKVMYDTRDNELYGTVQIGQQCWMAENLRYKITNAKEGYGNQPVNGYYYTWYQANGNTWNSGSKQGICPEGWHLPTEAEWQTLLNYVGKDARKLKSAYNWQFVNSSQRGNNSTGFSAVGTGKYYGNSATLGYNLQQTRFMTSNRVNMTYTDGSYVELYYNTSTIPAIIRPNGYSWGNIEAGSVRCIKN